MYHGKKKKMMGGGKLKMVTNAEGENCLLYTSDAAD